MNVQFTRPTPVTVFPTIAELCRNELAKCPEQRARLAAQLKLPPIVLDLFRVGYNGDQEAFTVPEKDGCGTIIGIATRSHRTGGVEKRRMKGSHCGLTIPFGWRKRPGALFCVEGFTDTAAMTAADLCAVGRASNRHGAKLLAVLLRNWPVDRDIVIVGDNDLKPNGDWPGKVGADAVARQLAPLLNRTIYTALPPTGVKDVREWLTHPDRDALPWPDRGAELAATLHHQKSNNP